MYPNPNKNRDCTSVTSLFPIKVRLTTSLTRKLMKDFFFGGGGPIENISLIYARHHFRWFLHVSAQYLYVCTLIREDSLSCWAPAVTRGLLLLCPLLRQTRGTDDLPYGARTIWCYERSEIFFHALGNRQQFTNEQSKIFPLRWYSPLLTLIYNFVI